jgi:hypothetical protein
MWLLGSIHDCQHLTWLCRPGWWYRVRGTTSRHGPAATQFSRLQDGPSRLPLPLCAGLRYYHRRFHNIHGAPRMTMQDIYGVGILTLLANAFVAFLLNISVVLLVSSTCVHGDFHC